MSETMSDIQKSWSHTYLF